jgi:hypothetical protein
MARQYTPRAENARQATPSPVDKPNVEGVPIEPGHTVEPVAETDSGVEAVNDRADSDDDIDAPATGAEQVVVAPVKPRKAKTRAQLAREDAGKARDAQDRAVLEGAPTFEVTYPTGFSRFLPDDDELEVTMSGGSKVWVDVVNGHALIPQGGRVRAVSVQELTDFTRLAGQSFLKLAPPD